MANLITRLNPAFEVHYAAERKLGEGDVRRGLG